MIKTYWFQDPNDNRSAFLEYVKLSDHQKEVEELREKISILQNVIKSDETSPRRDGGGEREDEGGISFDSK